MCHTARTLAGTLLLAFAVALSGAAPARADVAQWTVLVYLDADNNLDVDGLTTFAELATVPDSHEVNVVVQYDRPPTAHESDESWSETLRFKMAYGLEPLRGKAIESEGELDMGDPATLADFIDWGVQHYPARHYALVIWDHGGGYRMMVRGMDGESASVHAGVDCDPLHGEASERSTAMSPLKSISWDDTSQDQLYNQEVQSAILAARLASPLDVLGFDACLMSMVETGYEFRKEARVMVASEELVPGLGWPYHLWVKALVQRPDMTPAELGKVIVASYADFYRNPQYHSPWNTLSVTDLSQAAVLAGKVSTLANACIHSMHTQRPVFTATRAACKEYGVSKETQEAPFYHVDLGRWSELVSQKATDPVVRQAAREVVSGIAQAVLADSVGDCNGGDFGSRGLAIYFPSTADAYRTDKRAENGYEKSNTKFPVDFVVESTWSDFLHAYLGLP